MGSAPQLPRSSGEASCEQVIIAPTEHELSRAWLGNAVSMAAQQLASSGLTWVIVPPRWRRATEAELRVRGLALCGAVLMTPPWPDTHHFISLAGPILRDALGRHLQHSAVSARIGGALVATGPGRRMARALAPGCALLAGHSAELPLFDWLHQIGERSADAPFDSSMPLVSRGPRADARVAVLLSPPPPGSVQLAVKVGLNRGGLERVEAERRSLRLLGRQAARAGAAVPVPLSGSAAPSWALPMSALGGQPAATILATAPGRQPDVIRAVADWLLAWNRATLRPAAASAKLVSLKLLEPVRALAEVGRTSPEYVAAMERLANDLCDQPLSSVSTHNDLTMSNVMYHEAGLGIVDWESGEPEGLPLSDLFYAVIDSVARATPCHPAQAISSQLSGAGQTTPMLEELSSEHVQGMGLSEAQKRLAFHSCWLGHASEELRRGGVSGPFLEVLSLIQADHILWEEKETRRR